MIANPKKKFITQDMIRKKMKKVDTWLPKNINYIKTCFENLLLRNQMVVFFYPEVINLFFSRRKVAEHGQYNIQDMALNTYIPKFVLKFYKFGSITFHFCQSFHKIVNTPCRHHLCWTTHWASQKDRKIICVMFIYLTFWG